MTFSLKIRYQYGAKAKDFINTNRLFSELHLKQEIVAMLNAIAIHPSHPVVQINITLSHFEESRLVTMDLLNYEEDMKRSRLTESMQKLRDKFGVDIIKSGGEL